MKMQISSLLFSLSTALDCVEQELLGVTSNHSRRVACLSMRLCRHLGMSEQDIIDMGSCAILHDNALTEYMLKRNKLSTASLENLHEHCIVGERNVEAFPFLGNARNIVLHHHENWDGSGFFKLGAGEFSDRAAILRLADNTDLLFKLGESTPEIRARLFEHVQTERGRLYAPHIVDAFVACVDDAALASLNNATIGASLAAVTPLVERCLDCETLLALATIFSGIIDTKSRFTLQHSQGIARIADVMSRHYGFDYEHGTLFVVAAHLHDVGKLAVPNHLLEKPTNLTDGEFAVVKTHADATYDILSMVEGMETIATWASAHHEKLDGTGYPHGLGMKSLGFEARLLTCIDIYQALTEDRPYRVGISHVKAIGILEKMASQGKIDGTIVDDLDHVLGTRH